MLCVYIALRLFIICPKSSVLKSFERVDGVPPRATFHVPTKLYMGYPNIFVSQTYPCEVGECDAHKKHLRLLINDEHTSWQNITYRVFIFRE